MVLLWCLQMPLLAFMPKCLQIAVNSYCQNRLLYERCFAASLEFERSLRSLFMLRAATMVRNFMGLNRSSGSMTSRKRTASRRRMKLSTSFLVKLAQFWITKSADGGSVLLFPRSEPWFLAYVVLALQSSSNMGRHILVYRSLLKSKYIFNGTLEHRTGLC